MATEASLTTYQKPPGADPPEEWRTITGWPYEVSSFGRVRRKGGRIKALLKHPRGYRQVALYNREHEKRFLVHRLVAVAFLPPASPDCIHVDHKNNVKSDNRPENLQWVSPAENARLSADDGLLPVGEGHPQAKLTVTEVLEIRTARHKGTRLCVLAERYGVGDTTISRAANGVTWAHLNDGGGHAP